MFDFQAFRASPTFLLVPKASRSAETSNTFDISADPLNRDLPTPNPPLRETIHVNNNVDGNYTPPGCPWIST